MLPILIIVIEFDYSQNIDYLNCEIVKYVCWLQGDGTEEPGGRRGGGTGAKEESQGDGERRREPFQARAPTTQQPHT